MSWGPEEQRTRNSSRRAGRLRATGTSPDRPRGGGCQSLVLVSSSCLVNAHLSPPCDSGMGRQTLHLRESRFLSINVLSFHEAFEAAGFVLLGSWP